MSQPLNSDYTHRLRSLMQSVGVSSFKELSRTAGVSDWQVGQLRQGKAARMQAEHLHKLSQTLQVPLTELLATFSDLKLETEVEIRAGADNSLDHLKQEYQRLQAQLSQQREALRQEFQQSSLQQLESLLIQLPTAAYAAQQNPQVSATKLLPLLRPVEQLLQSWDVKAIAPVGTELPYDPHLHQLMEGEAQPGKQVRVRYTGYRWGDKLLHRAKVSPVEQ